MVGPHPARGQQDGTRLICFPNAGGTAGLYASWRPHLPVGVDLWPIELPGHGVRSSEEPATDLTELARTALAALSGDLADGRPYALFGHSLGGLLAFELARLIERTDLPRPRLVVVSAVRAPHQERGRPVAADDDELLQWLLSSGGLPDELLRHVGFVRRLLRTLRADLEMADAYRLPDPAPLHSPLHVIGALADPVAPLEELADWEDWQELEDWESDRTGSTTFFDGGHGYLFQDPRPVLAHLAALLRLPHAPLDAPTDSTPFPRDRRTTP